MEFQGGAQKIERLGGLADVEQVRCATDRWIAAAYGVSIRFRAGIRAPVTREIAQGYRCEEEQHREHARSILRPGCSKVARRNALSCADGNYANTAIIY